MSIIGFLNKSQTILGNGRVAINDLKVIGDKAQDLLNNITNVFNSVINTPLDAPSNYGTQSFNQQQGGFGSTGFGVGVQQQKQGFNNGGFVQPTVTPSSILGGVATQGFKRSYRMELINTLADVFDAVAGQKNFSITYGKSMKDVTPSYTIASNIFLLYVNGVPTLHFNIDARNKIIRDEKKIKLMESVSALLTFIETMFTMCTTREYYKIVMQNNNIMIDIDGMLFGIGTLALMKYRLGLTGYAYGASATIDDFNITISGDFISIYKNGYASTNVSKSKFIQILNDIPALKYINITESEYIEYQDNPIGLTTRIIIELNRGTNTQEIISYSDIQYLDTYAGTQIKNALLGKELKRSEGTTIV